MEKRTPAITLGTIGPLRSGKTTLTLALARHYGGYTPSEETQAIGFGGPDFHMGDEKNPYARSRDPIYVRYDIAGRRLTHIDVAGLRKWNLSNYPQLERLDLEGTQITDAGLAPLIHLPLKQLALGSKVMTKGIQSLTAIKTLEQLDLSQTSVDDAGYLSLKTLPRLHTLFTGRLLTDQGLAALCQMPSLQRLDLSGSRITNAGAQNLAHLQNLEELALSQTPVGDPVIEALVALKKLRFLEISDTQVSEEGLKRLAAIPSLQVISFSTTGSTDVQRFQAWRALPKLHTVIINGQPMGYDWMQSLHGNTSSWLSFVTNAVAADYDGPSSLEVAPLKDRSPHGMGLVGLKRIHYVESELDNVVPAPAKINLDDQDNPKNFMGEYSVGVEGSKKPKIEDR